MTEQQLRDLIKNSISEAYKELDSERDSVIEVKEAIILSEDEINEKIEVLNINEGQFSWFTQDTQQQIGSEKQNTITVYMHSDDGDTWKEDSYEGYGEFGGYDYYALLSKMNGHGGDRDSGIDVAFGKKKPKNSRKVLFPALTSSKKINKNHDFTEEPESDPNQSWYQEEDYNESLITEASGNLKDLAEDLAELDREKGGMGWIHRIKVDQEYSKAAKGNIVVVKVTGRSGDNTAKSYVNKMIKKLGFKAKFFIKDNLGDFHEYMWHLPEFETSDQYKIIKDSYWERGDKKDWYDTFYGHAPSRR